MAFWNLSAGHRNDTALIDCSGSYGCVSYASLESLVSEMAGKLTAYEGRLGAIAGRNEVECYVGFLAALRARSPVLLLEDNGGTLASSILHAYKPDWLLLPSSHSSEYGEKSHEFGAWQLRVSDTSPAIVSHPEVAVLISTSGTTGTRRFARLSRTNLAANATAIAAYLELGRTSRAITTLPFPYAFGMSVLNSHLEAGGSMVLCEKSVIEKGFWDIASLQQPDSLYGVPYTFQVLKRLGWSRLAALPLRYVAQAGGRMAPEAQLELEQTLKAQDARFFVMYGQTEAAPRISYVPPEMLSRKAGSIGIPVPGGRLSLDDGELVFEGPNVMMGYAYDRSDLARGDELGGRLHTGDLGHVDDDGFWYVQGRKSRFIKMHGKRLSLDETEQSLEDAFGVSVACIGEEDKLSVFVEAVAESVDVRPALRQLGLHPSCFSIIHVPSLPRSTAGKKRYADLRPLNL